MLFNYAIEKTRTLALSLVTVFVFLIISVISNAILAALVYHQRHHAQIIIMPMASGHNAGYKLSTRSYDSRYLRDMGISFISLRLNVSPETVAGNHKLLLSYVATSARPGLVDILTKEEKVVIDDDLTSAFYFDRINVYPDADIFEVAGVLKTWSGKYLLEPLPKKYQLKVNYVNGTFEIVKFTEVEEKDEKVH